MKRQTLATLLGFTALLMATTLTQAQTVYRIVAPDGTVTFSDRPATTGAASIAKASSTSPSSPSTGINSAVLPYELRQVTGKYPVVLYSGNACPPCDTGRSILNARGIPFSERTVTTREDTEALKRLVGDNNLPYLTIGSQKIKGFSELEWTQYLDVAGYPKKSALPSAYKNPAPSALVATKKPAEAPETLPQEVTPMDSTPSESPSPESTPEKPRGFVF